MKLHTPKHVALVGLGPGRGNPQIKRAGAVWGINGLNLQRHVDAVFSVHDFVRDDDIYRAKKSPEDYDRTWESLDLAWAESTPVVLCRAIPDYPNTIAYPIDAVIAWAGIDYFTCTSAYMLAYALYTGAERIDLHGISGKEAYAYQVPCISYWLGHARGMGVEVCVYGAHSDLLRTDPMLPCAPVERQTRYGFDRHPAGACELLEQLLGEEAA